MKPESCGAKSMISPPKTTDEKIIEISEVLYTFGFPFSDWKYRKKEISRPYVNITVIRAMKE
jgi:hypothetical protein